MLRLFILEEEPEWRDFLAEAFNRTASKIRFFLPNTHLHELKTDHFDAILLNLQLKSSAPFNLLDQIKSILPYVPVIVTSRIEKTELVVKAIRNGAFDFVTKPFTAERIRHVVQQALEHRGLKNEIDYLRREQDVVYDFDQIVAGSPEMRAVIKSLKKFSQTDSTILITGETGTGKSFLSGSIHFNSRRRSKPFIKINCANIPETLLESELFGHEKGAFTGADKQRIGRFEQAHGGSLFLDEIGEMSLSLQTKLLRVLEEKAFERLGGNRTIYVDVRVIAATNRNLEELVKDGLFREDLYYRINVLFVVLPPLWERGEDIRLLANVLLGKACRSVGKKIKGFSSEVMDHFLAYRWPGNIRQMANIIERAVILEETDLIRQESVSLPELDEPVAPGGKKALRNHEKDFIIQALEKSQWVQKDAARILGVSPRTLNYKIKKHGITHPRWRVNKQDGGGGPDA